MLATKPCVLSLISSPTEELPSSLTVCREKGGYDITTEEEKYQGRQTGALFWHKCLVFTAWPSVSLYSVILPSCWTFFKIRGWSFPLPDSLKAPWQTSHYCVVLGAGVMPPGSYVYWEHFFPVKPLSEARAASSRALRGGLWWLMRKWGSGSSVGPHPVFRILASLHFPRDSVLENSTCFPCNKGFWKVGRPSWQRLVGSNEEGMRF